MTAPALPETPRDAASARAFLAALHGAGLLYHPEELAEASLAHHRLSPETLALIETGMCA